MASSLPRGHRLRAGRVSTPGQIYMITTTTLNRRRLFTHLQPGRCVVTALRQAEVSAKTLAFVVMPDHLHWLMQLNRGYELSAAVRFVKSASSRAVNRHLGMQGSVWSKGFYDHALRRDEDLLRVATYIINNPLRAGLVETIGDYGLWDTVWV